jgi:hypothetical protein
MPQYDYRMMNFRLFERNLPWPNRVNIPGYVWSSRGKSEETLLMVAGFPIEI